MKLGIGIPLSLSQRIMAKAQLPTPSAETSLEELLA